MGDIFYELTCQICGGQLSAPKSGNVYTCECCGKKYEKKIITDTAARLKEILNEQKQKEIANLRQLLWKETREEYVSNHKVEEYCGGILKEIPDDFYANFYLATCDRKKGQLGNFLYNIDIEAHYDDIPEILDYLIKALKKDWVIPVSDLIERVYKEDDGKTHNKYMTLVEAESIKIDQSVFEPAFPRDVFVAYSSKDIPEVEALVTVLEEEGLSCFVAARNLRHGSGSADNYDNYIHTAIEYCKTIVFVSSVNSRANNCGAFEEFKYINKNCSDKPRVEYLIKGYRGTAIEPFFKEFFHGLSYCETEKDVAERVFKIMETNSAPKPKTVPSSKPDRQTERANLLKKAKMLSVEGKYTDAESIYTQLKNANPGDMDAYIGFVRTASENFHLYEGEDIDERIRVAADMFGKELSANSEYRQYIKARNKYIKNLNNRHAEQNDPSEKPVRAPRPKKNDGNNDAKTGYAKHNIYESDFYYGKKICKKCGARIDKNSKHCTNCGSKNFFDNFKEYEITTLEYCAKCGKAREGGYSCCPKCGCSKFLNYEQHTVKRRKKISALITPPILAILGLLIFAIWAHIHYDDASWPDLIIMVIVYNAVAITATTILQIKIGDALPLALLSILDLATFVIYWVLSGNGDWVLVWGLSLSFFIYSLTTSIIATHESNEYFYVFWILTGVSALGFIFASCFAFA